MRAAWAAVIALVLTALDGVMTVIWVRAGYAVEGNPVLDYFISRFGLEGGMVLRVVVGIVLVLTLYIIAAHGHRSGTLGLWFVAWVLSVLVVWHAVGIWSVVLA